MGDPGMYARNAAAMWASLAPWSQVLPAPPGVLAAGLPAQAMTRVILSRPAGGEATRHVGALLAGVPTCGQIVVEDSFGELSPPPAGGVSVDRMPVMVRPAAAVPVAAPGAGTVVAQVTSEASLAQAERVIVDGFPLPALQPYRRGRALPALVLVRAGWQVWLACRDGDPAAACCCYDDGAVVGIYWLATLAAHRSHGLGRAVMAAALRAHPGRPAALVATAAGRPLYASLGFAEVSLAAWYRKPPRPPAVAASSAP